MASSTINSKLDQFFKVSQRGSNVKQEMIGGLTTFLTMSYIIFVNPSILSLTGMDKGALITVTCLVSALGTLLMAFMANVPMALAPGMGLNAFFTFTLVMGQGVSWQVALGVVFISGLFFMILSLSGVRQKIATAIPSSLIIAATAGIGLFIAFIGLQNMKIIVANEATLISLGEFTTPVLLSLFGLIVMIALEVKHVKGGILIGIMITTLIGMLLGEVALPTSLISMPPSIEPIAFKLDIFGALKWSLASAIFSFMFIDMFDSLALLLSCARQVGIQNKDGDVPDLGKMLYADVGATLIGATLGTSTVTSFGESAAGMAAGAKTGLASVVTAILFLLALFFTPIVAIVPIFAASPALVIVGVYMFKSMVDIDFSDMKVASSAFIMMLLMPLTYSISVGLSFGFLTYIFTHALAGEFNKISPVLWFVGALSVLSFALG